MQFQAKLPEEQCQCRRPGPRGSSCGVKRRKPAASRASGDAVDTRTSQTRTPVAVAMAPHTHSAWLRHET
eukprot:1904877-Rhodomonas_salina.2